MTPLAGTDATAGPTRDVKRWSFSMTAFVIALVCVLGSAVLLYPAAAYWFADLEHQREVESHSERVAQIPPPGPAEAITQAQAYNATLQAGGFEVGAGTRIPTALSDPVDRRATYHSLLNPTGDGQMGRLQYDAVGVDLPIYHGTGEDVLSRGVGHLEGTALPVGGVGTRSVLTGHRGLASSKLFTDMDKATVGDVFTITVLGEVLAYRVRGIRIVAPDDARSILPEADADLVTLVTCTPIGINSERILVTGERVLPTPPEQLTHSQEPPPGPGFPWWAVAFGLALTGAAVYVWWSGRPVRPKRAPRHVRTAADAEFADSSAKLAHDAAGR